MAHADGVSGAAPAPSRADAALLSPGRLPQQSLRSLRLSTPELRAKLARRRAGGSRLPSSLGAGAAGTSTGDVDAVAGGSRLESALDFAAEPLDDRPPLPPLLGTFTRLTLRSPSPLTWAAGLVAAAGGSIAGCVAPSEAVPAAAAAVAGDGFVPYDVSTSAAAHAADHADASADLAAALTCYVFPPSPWSQTLLGAAYLATQRLNQALSREWRDVAASRAAGTRLATAASGHRPGDDSLGAGGSRATPPSVVAAATAAAARRQAPPASLQPGKGAAPAPVPVPPPMPTRTVGVPSAPSSRWQLASMISTGEVTARAPVVGGVVVPPVGQIMTGQLAARMTLAALAAGQNTVATDASSAGIVARRLARQAAAVGGSGDDSDIDGWGGTPPAAAPPPAPSQAMAPSDAPRVGDAGALDRRLAAATARARQAMASGTTPRSLGGTPQPRSRLAAAHSVVSSHRLVAERRRQRIGVAVATATSDTHDDSSSSSAMELDTVAGAAVGDLAQPAADSPHGMVAEGPAGADTPISASTLGDVAGSAGCGPPATVASSAPVTAAGSAEVGSTGGSEFDFGGGDGTAAPPPPLLTTSDERGPPHKRRRTGGSGVQATSPTSSRAGDARGVNGGGLHSGGDSDSEGEFAAVPRVAARTTYRDELEAWPGVASEPTAEAGEAFPFPGTPRSPAASALASAARGWEAELAAAAALSDWWVDGLDELAGDDGLDRGTTGAGAPVVARGKRRLADAFETASDVDVGSLPALPSSSSTAGAGLPRRRRDAGDAGSAISEQSSALHRLRLPYWWPGVGSDPWSHIVGPGDATRTASGQIRVATPAGRVRAAIAFVSGRLLVAAPSLVRSSGAGDGGSNGTLTVPTAPAPLPRSFGLAAAANLPPPTSADLLQPAEMVRARARSRAAAEATLASSLSDGGGGGTGGGGGSSGGVAPPRMFGLIMADDRRGVPQVAGGVSGDGAGGGPASPADAAPAPLPSSVPRCVLRLRAADADVVADWTARCLAWQAAFVGAMSALLHTAVAPPSASAAHVAAPVIVLRLQGSTAMGGPAWAGGLGAASNDLWADGNAVLFSLLPSGSNGARTPIALLLRSSKSLRLALRERGVAFTTPLEPTVTDADIAQEAAIARGIDLSTVIEGEADGESSDATAASRARGTGDGLLTGALAADEGGATGIGATVAGRKRARGDESDGSESMRTKRSRQLLASLGLDAAAAALPVSLLDGKGGVPSASTSLLLMQGSAAVVGLAHALQAAYLPSQHLALRAAGVVRPPRPGGAGSGVNAATMPPIPPSLFDVDVHRATTISARLRYHDVPQLVTNLAVAAAQRCYPAITTAVTAAAVTRSGILTGQRYEMAISGIVLGSAALQRLARRGLDVVGNVEAAQVRVAEALVGREGAN